MKTTIDAAGRIVVPKALRDELQLSAGAELDIRVVEGHLEILPAPLEVTLERRGMFTVAVPRKRVPPLDTQDVDRTIEVVRRSRARS